MSTMADIEIVLRLPHILRDYNPPPTVLCLLISFPVAGVFLKRKFLCTPGVPRCPSRLTCPDQELPPNSPISFRSQWPCFYLAFTSRFENSRLSGYQGRASRNPRISELPKVWTTWWNQLTLVTSWLGDQTCCQSVTTCYLFARETLCSHLLSPVIWTLQTVHAASDTNTQEGWRVQSLGGTRNFSDRSQGNEISSCKEAETLGLVAAFRALTWEDSRRKGGERQTWKL